MDEDGLERQPVPPRLVVVAYLLALTCALAPFALIGALFAGMVLAGRGRAAHGAGVVALGVACTALFVLVIR